MRDSQLKFAGALKGKNTEINGVQFRNGVCHLRGGDEFVANMMIYLSAWQALPFDEADALQIVIDKANAKIKVEEDLKTQNQNVLDEIASLKRQMAMKDENLAAKEELAALKKQIADDAAAKGSDDGVQNNTSSQGQQNAPSGNNQTSGKRNKAR